MPARPSSPRPFRRRTLRAFTLVEVATASSIALMVAVATISLFTMCKKFLEEALWENRLRSDGAVFMEKAKEKLTFAYRFDAVVAADRPTINAGKYSISFSTPDDTGDGVAERYVLFRTDSGTGNEVRMTKNGALIATLKRVSGFQVETQEGLIALVTTVDYQVARGGWGSSRKQFTLVARALPRNMGRMTWNGT